jgi:hypothetical protein
MEQFMIRRTLRAGALAISFLVISSWWGSAYGQADLVTRALEDSSFTWRSSESEGVRIYYQPASFAERHRAMLLRSASGALREALECLDEPKYERPLQVFYVNSRQEMERLVGRAVTGFANWDESGVFVVFNPEWRSFEKHEITHVLTMELWGAPDPGSRWMVEGLPIYCDGWCREYSVDEIAFKLLSSGELPPLEQFFDDFAKLGEIRAGFYAASVIGFIRLTYGAEALRALWLNGHGDLEESIGVDADRLETSWKRYLKSAVDTNVEVNLESIKRLGCG